MISGEIKNYTAELERRKNEKKKPLVLSDRIAKLIHEMYRGVHYGPQGLVPVMTWDDRFVLIKRPGHSGWSGRGSYSYIPVAYTLHDSTVWEAPEGTRIHELKKNIDAIVERFRNAS